MSVAQRLPKGCISLAYPLLKDTDLTRQRSVNKSIIKRKEYEDFGIELR